MMRSTIFPIALAACLVGGCFSSGERCDPTAKKVPPFWFHVGSRYSLYCEAAKRTGTAPNAADPLSVVRSNATLTLESGTVGMEMLALSNRFFLDVTNKSAGTVRIAWPDARYVDELGDTWPVFHYNGSDGPPDPGTGQISQDVKVGTQVREIVAPAYKEHWTTFTCEGHAPFMEALLPTRLDDKDEVQAERYLDDVVARQVPVKLIVPIEIAGSREEYTFTFVLKPN
jgi:hypothetical protein